MFGIHKLIRSKVTKIQKQVIVVYVKRKCVCRTKYFIGRQRVCVWLLLVHCRGWLVRGAVVSVVVMQQSWPQRARCSLSSLRERNLLTDVKLVADNAQIIPAHKAVLSAHSAYLRCMFDWNPALDTIHLNQFDPVTLHLVVDYVYKGRQALPTRLTYPYLQLFTAADYFDIPALRNLCARQFRKRLTLANCVYIYALTRTRHKDAEDASLKFISHNLESILLLDLTQEEAAIDKLRRSGFDTDTYMPRLLNAVRREESDKCNGQRKMLTHRELINLYRNERKLLVELDVDAFRGVLGGGSLRVRLEESIFLLLLWWTLADDARPALLCHVLSSIPFTRFSTDYLRSMLPWGERMFGLVFNDSVDEIVRSRCDYSPVQLYRQAVRLPARVVLAVGGWSGRTPTDIVEMYNPASNRWNVLQMASPLGRRAYHGLTRIGSKVYLTGGFDGALCHQASHVLDTDTMRWSYLTTMHLKRCYISVCRLPHNKIMAMGGYREPNRRTNTVEIYDPQRNQWDTGAPMTAIRSDAHSTRMGDNVYMVGGFNGDECLQSVEMFDPKIGMWLQTPRMNTARSGVGAASLHGCIYAVGGFNGQLRLKSVERYDPREGLWQYIASMNEFRSNFGICTIDGCVLVAGGYTGPGTTRRCEKYEPRMNEWLDAQSMTVDKSALYLTEVKQTNNLCPPTTDQSRS